MGLLSSDLTRILLVALLLAPISRAGWIYYSNLNAVNGCGLECTNATSPYVCLGTFKSVSECSDACIKNPKCELMSWSANTGNCWTRSDNSWEPVPFSGITAGCNSDVIPNCAPSPIYNGPISSTISNKVLGRTHPLSPAVTLDFWRWDDPQFGEKWMNSSALEIDLTSPQLRALASQLAPAILRLGGSPEDSLIFDADGTCIPMSGGNGPAPNGYYCSQVHPYSYDCMTPTRWNELLQFASETGLKIALGLNGCYGRMSSTSLMDLSNIKALLQATVASPYTATGLWGFEFSNEVVPNTISPAAWAADMTAIKVMTSDLFTSAGLPLPNMVGPDQGGYTPIASVAADLPAGVLDAYTYHQYPECVAPSPADGYVFDPSCLLQLDTLAAQCVSAAANYSAKDWPVPPVWAGESADHSGGGIANLTDTFRSSFYYAWQLGALPASGVELAARQCLSGGDYELLQRGTFEPNPDYFVIWLFHALIGGNATAYTVQQNVSASTSGVRVFAFSATPVSNGSMTLLALNLQSGGNPISINLAGVGSSRVEYHLTGDVAQEHGPIACNGTPLTINSKTYLPPAWQTLGVARSGPLMIAPASIVFATVL